MPPRFFTFALLLASFACGAAEQPPVVAKRGDPALRHHEIRPADLPRPYATESSSNSPYVVSRPRGAALHLPEGFSIALWATGLDNPRNMLVAPNGDLFVAETGAGRIRILRDADRNGTPESMFTFAENLNEPFGLVLHGDALFVGNTDGIVRFAYKSGQTKAASAPAHIFKLPGGGHSTRNVAITPDGTKLLVAVGSGSNVNDETSQPLRAAITELNLDGSGARTYASGLRNPVGLAWNPANGALWTAVNERDGLGDDLVPDYATELQRGGFYGWPFAYIGKNEEPRRKGERPDLVAKSIVPSVLIGAHSAPLGITFYRGAMFPERYRGGAFVALHGSWNRSERVGYSVIHIPFRGGRPLGGYDDFVTGWAHDPAGPKVWGRPVGVTMLPDGSLLIADDGANVIWRVTYRKP
jgi:glucose/arabinose dehydrogenase